MVGHCRRADLQGPGDRLVAFTGGDEVEHVVLALGELRNAGVSTG
jgi:hypothetical protein